MLLEHRKFVSTSEESMSVSSIAEKTVEQIFMGFLEKDGHDSGSNLGQFMDVAVNPLKPGSMYLFPGTVFVCNIMENGERIFMKFSWNVKHDTRNSELDCFIPA